MENNNMCYFELDMPKDCENCDSCACPSRYDVSVDQTIFETCEENLLKGSAEEMTNVIYDTLMGNTDYPQFDVSEVEFQDCDEPNREMWFQYKGFNYKLEVSLLCRSCPQGGDPSNDCADCVYSGDYYFVDGECVRRII
jgi:hypothetical protein